MKLVCAEAGDWPTFVNASPLLVKALGPAPLCEVWQNYKRGHAQLWLAFDDEQMRAACVTVTSADTMEFWLCGGTGSVATWRDLGDRIAEAARGHFRRMIITGRPGWGRILGFTRNDDGDMERIL